MFVYFVMYSVFPPSGDLIVEHSRSQSLPDDSRINGQARSSGSSEILDSTDSSSGEVLLDDRPVPTPRQRVSVILLSV